MVYDIVKMTDVCDSQGDWSHNDYKTVLSTTEIPELDEFIMSIDPDDHYNYIFETYTRDPSDWRAECLERENLEIWLEENKITDLLGGQHE